MEIRGHGGNVYGYAKCGEDGLLTTDLRNLTSNLPNQPPQLAWHITVNITSATVVTVKEAYDLLCYTSFITISQVYTPPSVS
ncbi:hypothetical protein VTK56DRAFT_7700 [Thermocarpiscus australiensis]